MPPMSFACPAHRVRNLEELKQVVDPEDALLINIQRGQEGFFVVLR